VPNVTVIEPTKIVTRDNITFVMPHGVKHNGPIETLYENAYVIIEDGVATGGRLLRS
jgi:hypothetical protein